MQQFAAATAYPRSIAWLVFYDDWDSLEEIIKYNCTIVGGYFNIIIPVTGKGDISKEYIQSIFNFDPDIVVLAKGMSTIPKKNFSFSHPFAIISWNDISSIVSSDAWSCGSGMNANVPFSINSRTIKKFIVAVEDKARPDQNRFALMACGDVNPRECNWDSFDGELTLDAVGHREVNLGLAIKAGINPILIQAHEKKFTSALDGKIDATDSSSERCELEFVSAPDRLKLANLISEENQFPLRDAVKILDTCCKLQHFPLSELRSSFINLTAYYKKSGGTPKRHNLLQDRFPGMVILVSDHFTFDNAVLFWNLRASEVYVSWLSFSDLGENVDQVAKWLDSDFGGKYFSLVSAFKDKICFSSSNEDQSRLQSLFNNLNKRVTGIQIGIIPNSDLIFYDYIRPYLMQESVIVARDQNRCSFIHKMPQEKSSGVCTR
jgi:hypothetical protein